tara:strand:+ start:323 stop:580 length:258 start_codon:yes stop_codon:yes gene_type:complete
MSKQLRFHQSIVHGNPNATRVVKTKRNPVGDIAGALRGWKSKLKTTGTIDALKARREYIKPTTKKREARKTSIYNAMMRQKHMYD